MRTQEHRIATRDRIMLELGVDRIGVGPEAPPLPPRHGREAAFAVGSEILGYQLHEYPDVWSRPALGLKIRSLISVATLSAIGHRDPLYRHINVALNLGITVEQLHDALLHVSCYGGFANWEHAVCVLNEVLTARGMASEIARGDAPRMTMTLEERDALGRRMTIELGVGKIGITRDEIQEGMVQAGVYHGVSGWNNAIGVARYVFEQQPGSGQD